MFKKFSSLVLIISFPVTLAFANASGDDSSAYQHYDAAVRNQQNGKLAEAVVEYKLAIADNAKEPSFYYSLGTAFQAMNDLDHAIESYAKALELKPKEPAYRQVLDAAKHTKAAPFIDSAIKKQTSTPPDLPGAIADYNQALSIIDDPIFRDMRDTTTPYNQRHPLGDFLKKDGELLLPPGSI